MIVMIMALETTAKISLLFLCVIMPTYPRINPIGIPIHQVAKNPTAAINKTSKANIIDDKANVLSHQASSMLNSFSVSNGLVFLPDGTYELKKGDKVAVYLL